jgi:hypothetical protein
MPTLTSPHDLITAIPFLLGFKPTDSIVLIAVQGGSLGVVMRVDLPNALASEEIDLLAHHLLRDGADAALLVAYLPDSRDDGDLLLISLGAGLIRNGIEVQESIVVSHGRYRSIICRDLNCCPSAGQELPEIESSEIAAEHVIAGIPMPYSHISELIDSLAAAPTSTNPRWRDQVARFVISDGAPDERALQRDGVETMDLLLDEFRLGHGIREEILAARMIGRMSDVHIRDYALGVHSEESFDLYFTMWRELLRLAPPGFIAPLACIVAAMSYESGDGALAQKALDRAIADEPGYPLAGLLRRVFNAGWPPQSFAQMRQELHPKVVAAIFE